jgi:NAD-dependent deacetylase
VGLVEVGDVERLRRIVEAAASVTVLTGAGISTDSGIPDFRGPQGLWTKNPGAQRLFTLDAYLADPAIRREAWKRRASHPAHAALPNDGHRAIVALERSARLRALLTQNIDGLHQAAGSDPDLVVELHGSLQQTECLSCGVHGSMDEALARHAAGEADPACTGCGGITKAATISFGQQLRPDVIRAAAAAARQCEVFLAAGSSLTVQPAAGLCSVAVEAGARLVVANAQPTPYDELALDSGGLLLRTGLGELLPAALGGLLQPAAG